MRRPPHDVCKDHVLEKGVRMSSHGKDNVSQSPGRRAVWGCVTSLTLTIAYGQLLALYAWWPLLFNSIVNTHSLSHGELHDLRVFDSLVLEFPGVVHAACFVASIWHMWSGWRWGVTLLASIAGAGITGMVLLKMIVDCG